MKTGEPTELRENTTEPEKLENDALEAVTGGGYGYYRVRQGDTLQGIAQLLGIKVNTLMALNGIVNADLIYPGQSLKYPC